MEPPSSSGDPKPDGLESLKSKTGCRLVKFFPYPVDVEVNHPGYRKSLEIVDEISGPGSVKYPSNECSSPRRAPFRESGRSRL
jgi:hypothetical protein